MADEAKLSQWFVFVCLNHDIIILEDSSKGICAKIICKVQSGHTVRAIGMFVRDIFTQQGRYSLEHTVGPHNSHFIVPIIISEGVTQHSTVHVTYTIGDSDLAFSVRL